MKGKVIRVLYPYSLSDLYANSVSIKENSEYVFANCWVLDEKYTEYGKKHVTDDMSEPEKHADVVIGSAWSSLFPMDDGKVMLYHGYFDHDEEAKERILPTHSIATDKLTSPDSLSSGDFIAMNWVDFEKAFFALFENPDQLPTVDRQQ